MHLLLYLWSMHKFHKLDRLVQSVSFWYGLKLSFCFFFSLFFYPYSPYFLVFIYVCPTCLPNTHNLIALRYFYRDSLIVILAKYRQKAHARTPCINLFIETNKLPLVIWTIAQFESQKIIIQVLYNNQPPNYLKVLFLSKVCISLLALLRIMPQVWVIRYL